MQVRSTCSEQSGSSLPYVVHRSRLIIWGLLLLSSKHLTRIIQTRTPHPGACLPHTNKSGAGGQCRVPTISSPAYFIHIQAARGLDIPGHIVLLHPLQVPPLPSSSSMRTLTVCRLRCTFGTVRRCCTPRVIVLAPPNRTASHTHTMCGHCSFWCRGDGRNVPCQHRGIIQNFRRNP